MPKRFYDVSGEKFGKLTVIHCNLPPRKRAYVRCDCGAEFAVGIGSLTRGKTKSCGSTTCSSRVKHNLLGRRFGMLRVENIAPKNTRGELHWICRCDCGTLKRIKGSHLTHSGVDSCGCRTSIKRSKKMRKPIKQVLVNCQFKAYASSAKSRSLVFTLTRKQITEFLFDRCHYCSSPPYAIYTRHFVDGTSQTIHWNGIDRIDPTKGYTQDNCVSCCKICNAAKSNYSLEEFNNWVLRLTTSMYAESIRQSNTESVS